MCCFLLDTLYLIRPYIIVVYMVDKYHSYSQGIHGAIGIRYGLDAGFVTSLANTI